MPIPLAPTKLAVPRARPGLIHRARLLDLAVLGFAGPLTLVSAPPGWGKTTLLLQALERHAGPWAWLTVDPADNDPARFVRYLGAALGTVSPSAGTAAEQLLEADGITPAVFVQHLIPELDAQPEDCVLVLDDVHVLDQPSVLDGCRLLVEHLPPRLHLVLGTREDPPLPLARLRARGVLTEIRAADLRFTPEEAHMFLTGTMGLNLPADDAVVLAERTEGWAAGLQLAALSLRGRDNPQAFVRAFAGSHRYVGDYLVDEVLARQPPDLQDFLLRTAILERLSGPLCQALTTRDDSQSVLEHLERANLFVVSLDDQRRWYRYHQLFGDLLRSRLAATRPAEIPALHLRASTWHEREAVGGELEHVLEAIHHALAAGDVERTAHLLDSAAGLLLAENQQLTLLAWLEQLPESVLCAHAGLAIAHAWALTLTGGPAMLRDRRLDDAEHAPLAPRTDEHPASIEEHASALGNIALLRGYAARERGPLAAARARTQEALRLLPPEQAVTRTAGHLHLGVVASMTGELDEAERHLRQAARLGIGGVNRHAALAALTYLSDVLVRQGQASNAEATYNEVVRQAVSRAGRPLAVAGGAHLGIGRLLLARGETSAAATHLEQALALGEAADHPETIAGSARLLAGLRRAQGDHEAARTLLVRAHEAAARSPAVPEPPLPDELPPISGERSGTVPADDLLERPTPRELEVLALLAQGLSNQEIAERLVLTVGTVKWYLHHLYGKLGVGGRTAALARARALGLLS